MGEGLVSRLARILNTFRILRRGHVILINDVRTSKVETTSRRELHLRFPIIDQS